MEWKVEGGLIKLSAHDTLADGFQICALSKDARRKLSDKTYQLQQWIKREEKARNK